MLLFYVCHGDPIYTPDPLTPLGERHAESVAKRLSLYGVKCIWTLQKLENQRLMASAAMRKLGFDWYTHPDLPDCNWEGGFQRIQEETDKFLFSLGYQHIKESGTYQILKSNQERITIFAHGQFGVGFLSALLDIPYPSCVSHLEMCHSGVTVIEFREGEDGLAMPQILTLSNVSHLYRDGLSTKYNNRLYF